MGGLLVILLLAVFMPPVSALGWIFFGVWLYRRKFRTLAIFCLPFPLLSTAMMLPNSVGMDIFQNYGFFGRQAFEFWVVSGTLLASGWTLMYLVHAQLHTNER